MHVFIDTNILLNFFHYTKDELDALNNIFASHEHGSAEVHLTEQVQNEFTRNRENKVKDALKKFKETKFSPQLPSFMKGYEEYEQIRELASALQKKQKDIVAKVEGDIASINLLADRLIRQIFSTSDATAISREIFEKATMRTALGNPPGKNGSLGDSVNWIVLIDSVPDGEDIHVISEDGDFYSTLDDQRAHPFLVDEWSRKKKARLFVYRTISTFMETHFDGVAFSFDKNKEALIEELSSSKSFAHTHELIGKLESYSYFSAKEVIRILDAAAGNDQFGAIVKDWDVSDFLNRVAIPHLASVISEEHRAILKDVSEKQLERPRR
jgi:predicted nucleic acid-binding protein